MHAYILAEGVGTGLRPTVCHISGSIACVPDRPVLFRRRVLLRRHGIFCCTLMQYPSDGIMADREHGRAIRRILPGEWMYSVPNGYGTDENAGKTFVLALSPEKPYN